MRPEPTLQDLRLMAAFRKRDGNSTSPASKSTQKSKSDEQNMVVQNRSDRVLVQEKETVEAGSRRTSQRQGNNRQDDEHDNNNLHRQPSVDDSRFNSNSQQQDEESERVSTQRQIEMERHGRKVFEKHCQSQSIIQSFEQQAYVIRNVIRRKLFRNVKFLVDDMLVLDGRICDFVLGEIGRDKDAQKFRYSTWNTIKPVVKHAINTKRTSVSMIVKEKFLSKCGEKKER